MASAVGPESVACRPVAFHEPVPRFHITVLSNFARGYDRYRRVYSKQPITESRFTDRFFLLQRSELQPGIDKTRKLLQKLQIAGDQVIALETRVSPELLQPNLQTGIGQWIAGEEIEISAVHFVDSTAGLSTSTVEEMYCSSMHVLSQLLFTWQLLTPRSVSVLPIARGCEARCNFCFSHASISEAVRHRNLGANRVAAVLAAGRVAGAKRAVITGGGEPLLLPWKELLVLIEQCASALRKVVLITNGAMLARQTDGVRRIRLQELATAGLAVLALSVHHHDPAVRSAIMRTDTAPEKLIATWQQLRSAEKPELRFISVLQKGGIEAPLDVDKFLSFTAASGVREVCFKELYVSSRKESLWADATTNAWSAAHQVSLSLITKAATTGNWAKTATLPWGSPIYETETYGSPIRIAAYTEPSPSWERSNGVCRSWNLMADGKCFASLEDLKSEITL